MSVRRQVAAAFAVAFGATAALASETISYTYNSVGELVKVSRSGTVNSNASSCYSYDKASNRTNVTVATASDCSSAGGGGVSFSISSNGPVTEGTDSVFTITKTGTATSSLSVNYATANGTAVASGDYTAKSGTLTFTTAQPSQTVGVATVDDSATESAETFVMNLSAPTGGATLGTATATATVNDNDGGGATCNGVSFGVGNASAVEADALAFTVTKTGSPSVSCSVNYATADGTAVAPGDYVAKSGTLTFTAAQSSLTVSVMTNSNGLNAEPNETVLLNLSAPTGGATISDNQGVGTIVDDGLGGGGGGGPTCPQSCQ